VKIIANGKQTMI